MNRQAFSLIGWNLRGGAGARGQQRVWDLVQTFHLSIFAVCETHCPFHRVQSFWRSLGYELWRESEAHGHSGGIWILMLVSRNFIFYINDIHPQVATVDITQGNQTWCCSIVYGSPNPTTRQGLWQHLKGLRQRIINPWLAVGDYNKVCSPSEVVGGEFSVTRAANMLDMIDDCNFIDLAVVGSKLTWERRENGVCTIAKHLDCALSDVSWRHSFPEAFVEHLSRVYSDHSPLLVRCDVEPEDHHHQPFRFQATWTTHPTFEPLVQHTWA